MHATNRLSRASETALGEHLDWCKLRNLASATIEQRDRSVRRFAKAIGTADVINVDRSLVDDWWRELRVAPQTRVTYLSHVRQWSLWLVRRHYRPDDPSAHLDLPRRPRRLPRPMSEELMAKALADAPQPIRGWLLLAGYAGLRASEVAALAGDHVLCDAAPPVIVVVEGKGRRDRVVPMHPILVAEFGPRARPGYLWRNPARPGQPIPGYTVSHRANHYLHDHGIPDTFHSLRHRFATQLYGSSLDLRLTQELLGHASPVTTAAYAAWMPTKAFAAVAAIP